jgi:hypothetical protein
VRVGGSSELFSVTEFAVNDDETCGHAVAESLEYHVLLMSSQFFSFLWFTR